MYINQYVLMGYVFVNILYLAGVLITVQEMRGYDRDWGQNALLTITFIYALIQIIAFNVVAALSHTPVTPAG